MEEAIEFFIPLNVTDLETPEKLQNLAASGTVSYSVSETLDISSIAPSERAATLIAILNEITSKTTDPAPTMLFKSPETFDSLYSFVKELSAPGLVPKECRQILGAELSQLLLKLKKVLENYLKKPASDASQHETVLFVCRSSLKMYVFLLCQVLCATVTEGTAVVTSQPHSRKRRQRMQATDEDVSGLDVSTREHALRALLEALSPDIAPMWRNGQPEISIANLTLRTAFFLLSRKSNVEGDDNPIADGLFRLLGCLIQRYTEEYVAAQRKQAADGATGPITVSNPKDFIIVPLVDLLMKAPWSAKCCSRLIREYVDVADTRQAWAPHFLEAFYEAVASAAINDASADSQTAKNIAAFVEQESTTHLNAVSRFKDFFIPLLCSESYEIRKSALTAVTEMVIQQYTGAQRDSQEEQMRNKCLEDLLMRMNDLNPFVRSYCGKLWIQLFEHKAVPRAFYIRVLHEAVGRLSDRHPLVRSKALALLETCIRKSWLSANLSQIHLQSKYAELAAAVRAKFEDDVSFASALDAARLASITHSLDSTLNTPMDPDLNRLALYEQTIAFVGELHNALATAIEMLNSRTLSDVTASISFITTCAEYRLDQSLDGVRRLLAMIFVQEPKVQQCVCDAFIAIFFEAFTKVTASALTRNLARIQKLLGILTGASEGEVCSIERILSALRMHNNSFLNEGLLDAVWGMIDGSLCENCSPEDRRTAMRLFSMLTSCMPDGVATRLPLLLEIIRANPTDNILLAYAFTAIQHHSLIKGFSALSESVAISTHPVLSLLMHHLCRPTQQISSWVRMADAAITAIHCLHAFPVILYAQAAAYVANSYKESGSNDESRLAQLLYIVGTTAMKHLVSIDNYERMQMKRLDEAANAPRGSGGGAAVEMDVMQRELGVGSSDYKRHQIQDQCQAAKFRMLEDTQSIWFTYAPLIVDVCSRRIPANRPLTKTESFLRTGAILGLMKLMVASSQFCEQHLSLLFTVLSNESEAWINKTNIVVGLGDLVCIHPNLLQPYMRLENGFYSLLSDADPRVRRTTIQICTHLVLNDMLRPNDYLHTIVSLVADPMHDIAQTAEMFVQHLASKYRGNIGNFIPPLVAKLSPVMPEEKFEVALKTLLEKVEKDKPTESLVEKLCDRFARYTEDAAEVTVSRNVAFCLSELPYSSERVIKLLMSERCYQKYKSWLRHPEIFKYFQQIATKSKRTATTGERRDKAMIEEWEQRIAADSNLFQADDSSSDDGDEEGEEEEEEKSEEDATPADPQPNVAQPPAAVSESSESEGSEESSSESDAPRAPRGRGRSGRGGVRQNRGRR